MGELVGRIGGGVLMGESAAESVGELVDGH